MNLSLCEVISSSVSEWIIRLIQTDGVQKGIANHFDSENWLIWALHQQSINYKRQKQKQNSHQNFQAWSSEMNPECLSLTCLLSTLLTLYSASVCNEMSANAQRQKPLKLNGEGMRTHSLNKPLWSPKSFTSLREIRKIHVSWLLPQ